MREINEQFAHELRNSTLFELYQKHRDELFLGIREDCINLYYNGLSVCEASLNDKDDFSCKISSKYLGRDGKNRLLTVSDNCICDNYEETIKRIMKDAYGFKEKEKWAQQELVIKNNRNKSSNWHCIDIEYVRENNAKAGRIDIIALSKAKPHRVAIIEIKYNRKALGGKSGVFKHVSDFDDIIRPENGTNEFESYVKEDIVGIVASMNRIFENEYPLQINDAGDIANKPEFYFITLDNNSQTQNHSTPKMTMGGYVFNKDNPKYIRLGTKRQAKGTVESEFGDITEPSNKLYAQFLFSKDTVDKISIADIIDDTSYDREF